MTQEEHWFSFQGACIRVNEITTGGLFSETRSEFSDGSPLFFIHGRFGQAQMWEPLMGALYFQSRSYAIDLPGFGHSFSPEGRTFTFLEVVNLLNHVICKFSAADQKVILVGHDFGGSIAQFCALQYPEKIASVVLINTPIPNSIFKLKRVGSFPFLARWRLTRMLSESDSLSPFYKELILAPWKMQSTRKLAFKAAHELEDFMVRTDFKVIQNLLQPVLLLWGAMDLLNPPEIGVELMRRLSDASFFVNEQAGHWSQLEQPEWVLTKMRDFIFKTQNLPLSA